ncbi:arginine deiminase-related protein [Aestuariispira insulae]|uniref:Amidinotransferase n=1 Tax=Aestuariispira insulae TaxID=1461337 RepID=A0A3D9HWJ3_9PROT|nr:arginine deiminase-related protein [Aestuariispira insulae]RED53785.1 hypothetical protein DFP90_101584 [Aestuariispira insulae]
MEYSQHGQYNYIASSVAMVRPLDFTYDPQTAEDNHFQRTPGIGDIAEIRRKAVGEFNGVVAELRKHGVHVIVVDKAEGAPNTPNAVFPNNWFATESDGRITYFPMKSESRRLERQESHIETVLDDAGRIIRERVEIGEADGSRGILEGTGAMVIDRKNRIIYAALSRRCERALLDQFADRLGYRQVIAFETADANGLPIYHTNVMMAVGDTFAVICEQCIQNEAYKREILPVLSQDKEVITITREQMEQGFCGNILQLAGTSGEKLIVLSDRARAHFTPDQLARLEQHGRLIGSNIDMIESAGGGGIRCMLAEIFLPSVPAAV